MPRIDGQLKNAQFEQVASAAPVPAARGRFYLDITDPAAPVPKIFTGSQYLPIKLGQNLPVFDAGNSGLAATVDWNNGLIQSLTLTGHCTISFSNWRSGENHMLVVKQANLENILLSPVPYRYTFNLVDQSVRRTNWQPIGVLQSKELGVHSWFNSGDTGQTYAGWIGPQTAPATTPAAALFGISMSPDGKLFYTSRAATPYINYWKAIDEGAKFYTSAVDQEVASTAGPGALNMTSVHPSGKFVFWASDTTPFVGMRSIYASGAPNAAYANPGTLPTGAGKGVDVHPTGSFVAVAHTTTPFVSVYPVSAGGFGTKLADPGTLPAGNGIGVAWSPHGDFLAVRHETTPFLSVYPLDYYNATLGTKVANAATLPPGTASVGGKTVTWRPQGDWIVLASSVTPYIWAAPFNRTTGTFGTAVDWSTIPLAPSAAVRAVQFSPCGSFLVYCSGTDFTILRWGSAGYDSGTTPVFADGAQPGQQINDIVFHPHGDYFTVVLNASPWFLTYTMPRNVRRYIKQFN